MCVLKSQARVPSLCQSAAVLCLCFAFSRLISSESDFRRCLSFLLYMLSVAPQVFYQRIQSYDNFSHLFLPLLVPGNQQDFFLPTVGLGQANNTVVGVCVQNMALLLSLGYVWNCSSWFSISYYCSCCCLLSLVIPTSLESGTSSTKPASHVIDCNSKLKQR